MGTLLQQFGALTLAVGDPSAAGEVAQALAPSLAPWWVGLIPLMPLVGVFVCAIWAAMGIKDKLPAWATVGSIAVSFVLALAFYLGVYDGTPVTVTLFEWIGLTWGEGPGQSLDVKFEFYLDGLSTLWILFVTGLATAIAVYASEYMDHDVGLGYCRFFAAFGLFVFSMACLVMGSNMLMMFLGWEGVGLCSYLLIGYYYKKPEAVAAAQKAFVVNRIGDLGLLMAVFLTFATFGTLDYAAIFDFVASDVTASGATLSESWQRWAIPLLLCTGAFGKSAQLFFYVWLPDAMEGPTPVSALIHAATMVTAGIYLVARFTPLFMSDPDAIALTVVTWSGTITALWAATIAMAQFDIKRIMGYSTISQLGYMFAGLGALSTTGGVFHVLTHAFFKATLFLACGAVMHGFAGQLDMRKLSGVWHISKGEGWRGSGFKIVTIAMFIGCLNLAGFPFTAGYFSKDMILAEAFYTPDSVIWGSSIAGWVLLVTAGLTAYYTFRVFFRVFVGKPHAEPGDDHHGDDHGDDDHGHDDAHADHAHGGFHPHAPGWAINSVLAVLSVLSIAAEGLYFTGPHGGWTAGMVHASSADLDGRPWEKKKGDYGDDKADKTIEAALSEPAAIDASVTPVNYTTDLAAATTAIATTAAAPEAGDAAPVYPLYKAAKEAGITQKGLLFGQDPHKIMYYVSAVFGVVGISTALFLHGPATLAGLGIGARTVPDKVRADAVANLIKPVNKWAERKWYVDEFYHFIIVTPLRFISYVSRWFDTLIVDGLVNLFGGLPRWSASALRPATQTGVLHDYALRMVGGVAVILLIAAVAILTR